MVMDLIKLNSEMNLLMLSRLLDGTWRKVDLKKISRPTKFVQDFSTLQDVSQWVGELTKLSLELLLSKLKEQTNSSLWLSKILSMIISTKATRVILNKEMTQLTQYLCWKITHLNNYPGEAMNSRSSMAEANQSSHSARKNSDRSKPYYKHIP